MTTRYRMPTGPLDRPTAAELAELEHEAEQEARRRLMDRPVEDGWRMATPRPPEPEREPF